MKAGGLGPGDSLIILELFEENPITLTSPSFTKINIQFEIV